MARLVISVTGVRSKSSEMNPWGDDRTQNSCQSAQAAVVTTPSGRPYSSTTGAASRLWNLKSADALWIGVFLSNESGLAVMSSAAVDKRSTMGRVAIEFANRVMLGSFQVS